MEIKLHLRPQTIADVLRYLCRIELETMVLLLMIPFMLPFVLSSLWNVGMTILWEAFGLGVKAGLILFIICSLYFTFLTVTRWKHGFGLELGVPALPGGYEPCENEGKIKCSLMDIILTVVFQSGLRVPEVIWNPMMEFFSGDANWILRNRKMSLEQTVSPHLSSSMRVPKITIKPSKENLGTGSKKQDLAADVGGAGDYESLDEGRETDQDNNAPTQAVAEAAVIKELVESKVCRPTKYRSRRRKGPRLSIL